MIAGDSPFIEAVMPADASVFEVPDGRLSDGFVKILACALISEAKGARQFAIEAIMLSCRAEQLRFQPSISFLFSVPEAHSTVPFHSGRLQDGGTSCQLVYGSRR